MQPACDKLAFKWDENGAKEMQDNCHTNGGCAPISDSKLIFNDEEVATRATGAKAAAIRKQNVTKRCHSYLFNCNHFSPPKSPASKIVNRNIVEGY